ncbi:response regulator transcription factor [Candidatus Comchoanobacter bicostacola]|uniref:Response regulator transcription factor n=1 Tax=Candidatus Comchoanobacter bicostacola TaxID=2919598 RepID=A0ABY5DNA5_9GAMM|nr:response regulator transcription factor [Candidatus Comchoanobacter bicostacola]UTC24934.1 response regulator transcription factor [Candidatus Comchoanobacter bicostacola]
MRILLIEDDNDLGFALTSLLKTKKYTVDWLQNGQEALYALTQSGETFDLVIIDLGLPTVDGLEIIKQTRAQKNKVPIIILTARDQKNDIILGLDTGADDYLTKPFDFDVLNSRILALLRRRNADASSSNITIGNVILDPVSHTVIVNDVTTPFSRQEFKILHKLMESRNKVISRDNLTQILYGWGDDVDSNTIEVHMHNIRKKTKPHLAIKTIRGVGYIIA